MLETQVKIDFKIKSDDKISTYAIGTKLQPSTEDEARIDAFRDEKTEQYAAVVASAKEVGEVASEIVEVNTELSDINQMLEMVDDSNKRMALLLEKASFKKKLKKLKKKRDQITKTYTNDDYEKATMDIAESIAKESFFISVAQSEARDGLVAAIEKHNFSYRMVVGELNRLLQVARKKKSKT